MNKYKENPSFDSIGDLYYLYGFVKISLIYVKKDKIKNQTIRTDCSTILTSWLL